MQCHHCDHHEAVKAGKYASVPFRKTPCAKCELREDSSRTMLLELDRPAYMPGMELGIEPVCVMVPFPEEVEEEDEDEQLPVKVMGAMVAKLMMLPQELRDVVCWRFMGLTYQQIAKKQRLTIAGAEARHDRAMRMFPELRDMFALKMAKQKIRKLRQNE